MTRSAALPESVDAFVVTDTDADPGPFELLGTANAGDVWRIAFDEPLAALTDAGAEVFRVVDADGTFTDVDCNVSDPTAGQTEATCELNDAPVTIDGTTYEAGEVLTVTLGTVNATGGDGVLEYPLTITEATGFEDLDGDGQWTPIDDPDNVIDDEGTKTETGTFAQTATAIDADFADDATDPDSIFGDDAGDTVSITYDEAPVVGPGDTVILDADGSGATAGDQQTYTCATTPAAAGEVTCSVAGNVLTITATAATAQPGCTDEVRG